MTTTPAEIRSFSDLEARVRELEAQLAERQPTQPTSGPEDNPADDEQPDKDDWDAWESEQTGQPRPAPAPSNPAGAALDGNPVQPPSTSQDAAPAVLSYHDLEAALADKDRQLTSTSVQLGRAVAALAELREHCQEKHDEFQCEDCGRVMHACDVETGEVLVLCGECREICSAGVTTEAPAWPKGWED